MKRRAVLYPRVMGVFTLLIIILAFVVGIVQQEFALILSGAAFFLPWLYCLVMTLLLALIHNRRARRAFISLRPNSLIAGEQAEAMYSEGDTAVSPVKILQLPGILVRCRLLLATKDGRHISHDCNPASPDGTPSGTPSGHSFTVAKRGAYFSSYDEFAVFDILGLFRFVYRIDAPTDARLLASPRAANESPVFNARAGDSNLKPEFSFQRTDNLVDNRPYIPGDDPRRINWKLLGHGSGLFVREGEREPPPHSNMVILVDTEYDPLLYTARAGRRGIDTLCENALAAALACTDSGMDVVIGCTSLHPRLFMEGSFSEDTMRSALAWPAAMPLSTGSTFPAVPDDRGIIIFSLPRSTTEPSALDRFLKNTVRPAGSNARTIDILFIGETPEQLAAAETCAALYSRRQGMRVRIGNREQENE